MRAGSFRNLVKLQRKAAGRDPAGQPSTGWVDVTADPIRADIRNQTGLEAVKAGAMTSVVKTSVRIRYREGITAGMRLVEGATTYNITAVLPDRARRQFVDLLCEVVS